MRWKPETSVRTPTAPHTTETCPMHPSICQMSPQPRHEHHPPTTMSHHLRSKHPHLPKRDRHPHPSHTVWRSAKPPPGTPLSPLGLPPGYSTMHGPPTAPPTSPYPPKPLRTSSSNKTTSMKPSRPQLTASSPPFIATLNSTHNTCARARDTSWQNGSTWPNAMNASPPSNVDWGTSRYPQGSSPTMGALTAQSPRKRDSKSSPDMSTGWAMERWRCWQEGKRRNWSTSHSSTSHPITHPPRPNPCPPGSSNSSVDQLQGSTSSRRHRMPWTNGQYMLRYSATEKTIRSAVLSRLRSQSLLLDSPSCKSDWTMAEPALKRQKSPACFETLKDVPTSLVAHEDLHVEAGVSALMARECHSKERVMLPPGHAGELPQLGDRCDCAPKWHCDPHDTCFIHDSCFCAGSGSWPPVKPVRSYWHRFSSDWKAAMESPSRPLPFP
jgi:hypothetical protein